MWDVFISHAAEDKAAVARPLAEALRRVGFRVWYDEFTLRLGDSLSRTIDRGLAESRFGVVILSPHFLAKEWPRRELDGLTAREITRGKVILPVWHQLDRDQVERFSPTLADKLGVSTDLGIETVAGQIAQVLHGTNANANESHPRPILVPVPGPKPDPGRRRWMMAAGTAAAGAAVLAGTYLGISLKGGGSASGASIAGRWVIEGSRVTPRTYLDLQVADGRLTGTSEILYPNHPDLVISGLYAQRKTAITDSRLGDGTLAFTTRRRYTLKLGNPSTLTDLVHRYEGRLDGDRLRFTVQVEGGPLEEVVAERVRPMAAGAVRVATLTGHTGSINQVALLPDGRLASASRDETARVWNLPKEQADLVLRHKSQVQAVFPNGAEALVSVQDSGPLQEWDLASGKLRREFEAMDGRAVAVGLLGDGRLAVSLTTDRINVWNLASGRVERTLAAGRRMVVALAPMPDGSLACGDADGAVTLWDVAADKALREVRAGREGSGRGVSGLQALLDGRLVYSIAGEAAAVVWDPRTGRESQVATKKPVQWTELLAALPDGRLVLNDSGLAIVLSDPTTGRSEALIDLEREEYGVGCAAPLSGARLAVGMGDGPIGIWRYP